MALNFFGEKKIMQPLGAKKITQPLVTKISRNLSGQKKITQSLGTEQKITQPLETQKYPKNPNLSHNQNPGDRHRSPWSCYYLCFKMLMMHFYN